MTLTEADIEKMLWNIIKKKDSERTAQERKIYRMMQKDVELMEELKVETWVAEIKSDEGLWKKTKDVPVRFPAYAVEHGVRFELGDVFLAANPDIAVTMLYKTNGKHYARLVRRKDADRKAEDNR